MLRKMISWALTLVMVLSVVCGGISVAHAASADLNMTTEKNGNTVTVNVVAKGNFDMCGLAGWFEFDEEAFTLDDVSSQKLSYMSFGKNAESDHPDLTMFSADSPNGMPVAVNNGDVLLVMTFTATGSYDETNDYTFKLIVDEFYNIDGATQVNYDVSEVSATLKGEGGEEPPTPAEAIDLTKYVLKKTVQGADFDAITFTFNVTPMNGAPAMFDGNKTTLDVAANAAGEYEVPMANFADGAFTAEGYYYYAINEVDDGEKYWNYSTDQYVLEIFVQEIEAGKFAPTAADFLTYTENPAVEKGQKTDPKFTNQFNFVGTELTLTNTNVAPVDADKTFHYVVEFAVPTKGVAIKADGVALTGNKYEGDLKGNQKVLFTDIPVGTSYTITETGVKNHTHTGSGDINETGDAAKLVGEGELKLTYTISEAKDGGYAVEVKNEIQIATLKIEKVVTGDPAFQKEFSFTVTFTAPEGIEGMEIGFDQNVVTLADGKYTFTLKNGENVVFTNIPVGTTYTLTEEGTANYIPSYVTGSGESGEAGSGLPLTANNIEIQPDENTITVTNEYNLDVPTGVTIHTEMILILALVLVAMVGSVVLTKKLRRA